MESKSIYSYFFFGTAVRYLQDITSGSLVHKRGCILDNLDTIINMLNELKLIVSKRAASDLINFREKLKKKDKSHKLTTDEALKLRNLMHDLRKTINAEISGLSAFVVTDKRIEVKKLLSDVSALMAPGIFDSLSNMARYDFKQAGKCIAFELSTAAAFHSLRGTESVLKDFYCFMVKHKRVKPLMWGPMVESMRQRRKKPPEVLLNNLDSIRLTFRNPTQHPEKIYDIQETQDLFLLCIEVVSRMVKIMNGSKE